MTTSLRRLAYFLDVCETLHIGKSAERLGIAQPALSQQIKKLETELHVQLFRRRKRGIELTVAGEAYRVEVQRLLIMHEHASKVAQRTARGELGSVHVGYSGSAMFEPEFPALLKGLREHFPGIQLTLRQQPIEEQLEALERGDLDIVVVRGPSGVLTTNQRKQTGSRRPLIVALPSDHPLLAKPALSIADLADEPMIGFNDPSNLAIQQIVRALADRAGIRLNVVWQVPEVASIMGLVAAGMGYGIVPAPIASLKIPSVSFRPMVEKDAYSELWYIWDVSRFTPAVERFLELLRLHRFLPT
ncbi:HTH-type transcriptional regulator CatM [Pseudomonas fluorescens]|nr:HTH-type transcriptional regulator CatM [Pseudomonas fluorescens]